MSALSALAFRLYLAMHPICPATVEQWDELVLVECRGSVDPLCGLPEADECGETI